MLSLNTLLLILGMAALVVGLSVALRGEIPWAPASFFAICAILYILRFRNWQPYSDVLELSEWGIRRTFGPALRRKQTESVAWDALAKVWVITTDSGPFTDDMFFLLYGAHGKGVLVSNGVAVKHGLLAELHERLPGLDAEAIIRAAGSFTNNHFLIWEKPVSEETCA